ncbi:hypothetical protein FGB62_72g013 [Gracilaria domingensis]|nr:hypothetical protein FGB62_72g013 [Gracilaria domingensis]
MTGSNDIFSTQAGSSTAPLDLAHCTVENIFSAFDSTLRSAILTNDEGANVESLDNKQLILRALKRKESLEAISAITPSEAMQYMLQASVDEDTKASIEDTPKLKQTLLAAHQIDTALPAVPDTTDDKTLLLTALTWKVILHQKLGAKNAAKEVADAALPSAPATFSHELATGAHDIDVLELELSFKKQKGVYVGGVQVIDQQGKDTVNRPLRLGPYLGKDHAVASLWVQTLMGSKILRSLL